MNPFEEVLVLEKEYSVFNTRREEFMLGHKGQYVVIQGDSVKGFFPTEKEAFESMKDEKLGTFVVQHCVSIEEETARYASRVVTFA